MHSSQSRSKPFVLLRNALSWLAATIALAMPLASHAGRYVCQGYGDNGCAEHISDLVTDEFTQRYPADKFKLVVVYAFIPYSDGGGVGYAMAGISPQLKANGIDFAIIPKQRYSWTTRRSGPYVGPREKNELEVGLIRGAVENLMESCRKGPCFTP